MITNSNIPLLYFDKFQEEQWLFERCINVSWSYKVCTKINIRLSLSLSLRLSHDVAYIPLLVSDITSMEDGKQGLVELQETKIFTWELSVSIVLNYLITLLIYKSKTLHMYVCIMREIN